jgi:hypothetical protein
MKFTCFHQPDWLVLLTKFRPKSEIKNNFFENEVNFGGFQSPEVRGKKLKKSPYLYI